MKYNAESVRKRIDNITNPELRQKNRFKVFMATLLIALFIGFILILGSMGIGAFVEIVSNAPDVSDVTSIQPSSAKSLIYAADGTVMQELVQSGSNRISVKYEDIPENMVYAIVSIEDERFFQHDGVDVKGIIRAIVSGITNGSFSEGASTLTQQLIKNALFNGGAEKNFGDRIERKIQEQSIALKVEQELSKEEIVACYLNTVNFGSNCLGVQVAAKRYFGKDISELDLSECTVLAAIVQNPTRLNPIRYPEKNQQRRLGVLKHMLANGYISQEEYDEAATEDVYRRIQTVNADYTGSHAFSYFTDTVFEDVLQELQDELGYTETQAYNLLYSGGLRIYTTMDPKIQAIVDEECNNPENYKVLNADGSYTDFTYYSLAYRLTVTKKDGTQEYYDETCLKAYYQDIVGEKKFNLIFETEDALQEAVNVYRDYVLQLTGGTVTAENITQTLEPQLSAFLIDQKTGYVKAIVGGRGDKDETGSLSLNRATDSTRQPGSCFKILTTYAPALDICGATLATTAYDTQLIIDNRSILNWWGKNHVGYANIREGVMASMNTFAVKILNDTVTVNTGYEYARSFGITTLVSADKNPLLPLGGLTYGATNEEMTAAYACIANDGVYTEPIYWTLITDASGNVILEKEPQTKTVIKKTTARLLTSAMESSIDPDWFVPFPRDGITATSIDCLLPTMAAAGKSGTTTAANDIWFIGYTPYYTLGVWSGYDSGKSFGSSPGYHKVIWQNIMERVSEFNEPAQFDYSSLVKCTICSKSGLLAKPGVCENCYDENCHIYEEYFAPGTEPKEYCNRHALYSVCLLSGELASEDCPEAYVYKKAFLSIDSEDQGKYQTSDDLMTFARYDLQTVCELHHTVEPTEEPTEEETGEEETDQEETGEE